jgi:hypothetical protein
VKLDLLPASAEGRGTRNLLGHLQNDNRNHWTIQIQNQSYLTADGQSASLFRYHATVWDPRPILFRFHGNYLKIFAVSLMWFALSDETTSPELETISYCLI